MVDLSKPHRIIGEAARSFESLLSGSDARLFEKTTLADVQEAALAIQRAQADRKSLQNIARLAGLFKSLPAFAAVLQPLCPEPACLNFLWAPIEQSLQASLVLDQTTNCEIADGYASALDQLIDSYQQIAEHLPLFDRLTPLLLQDEGTQSIIAHVYGDILEFHYCAYRLLRQNSWKVLFDATWKNFALRFNGILERLGKSRDVLAAGVDSIAVLADETFRREVLNRMTRLETERDTLQLRNVLTWLNGTRLDEDQESVLQNRSIARQQGTCEWILENPNLRSWLDPEDNRPLLWLHGKPGSEHDDSALGAATSYWVCVPDHRRLDQCEPESQASILAELASLWSLKESSSPDRALVKVLICSRSTVEIYSKLRKFPGISLSDEKKSISEDIAIFVKKTLAPLHDLDCADVVEEMERMVVAQADGMFLWAKLAVAQLLSQHTVKGLHAAWAKLPPELSELYTVILHRLQDCDEQQKRHINHVLGLLVVAYRPLKVWEVCDAMLLQDGQLPLNSETNVLHDIIDMCKPFVGKGNHQTIRLVHWSAKDYLLTELNGPCIQLQQAHINITQACIRCLTTCHPFTKSEISPESQKQIVKGDYDFVFYAYEYWIYHLRESFRSHTAAASTDLADGRKTICHMVFDMLKAMNQSRLDKKFLDSVEALKDRLNTRGSNLEDILRPILRPLANQTLFLLRGADPSPRPGSQRSSSILDIAFTNFQNAFEELYEAGSSFDPSRLGIAVTDLDSFKTRHSPTPYLCRYSECGAGAVGFTSAPEREEHELCHRGFFGCTEPACDFRVLKFASWIDLRRHAENYHGDKDAPSQTSHAKGKRPRHGSLLPPSTTKGKAGELRTRDPTHELLRESEVGTLARIFRSCVRLLKSMVTILQESQAPPHLLEGKLMRALNTLQLWGDAYQVDEGYLDKLLCKSTELRTTTATLLAGIGSILSSRLLGSLFQTEKNRLAAIESSRIQSALDDVRHIAEDYQWLHDDDELADERANAGGDSNSPRAEEVEAVADGLCDYSLELMQMTDLFDSPFLHEKVSNKTSALPLAESTKSLLRHSDATTDTILKAPSVLEASPPLSSSVEVIKSSEALNIGRVQKEGRSALHDLKEPQKILSFTSYCYGMISGKVLVQSGSPLSVSDLVFVPPDRLYQTPEGDQWASFEEQVASVCASLVEYHGVSLQISVRNDNGKDGSSEKTSTPKKTPRHQKDIIANIIIYGPPALCESVGDYLSAAGFFLQHPTHCNQDVPYLNPHVLGFGEDNLQFTSELFPGEPQDETELDKNPLSNFYSSSEFEETAQPDGIATAMAPHQKKALTFMIERERGWNASNDFWTTHIDAFGTTRYKNTVSGVTQASRPTSLHGGILADGMGMGKTLSMLSLIVANPSRNDESNQHGKNVVKSTLIVVPSSLLLQAWQDQIRMHCRPEHVRYQILHGPERHKAVNIGDCDIVLTTYNTVSTDWKRNSSEEGVASRPNVLFETSWYRVVLDEAHFIRNQNTKSANSVYSLTSQRRWCITGTPIQNRLTDLFSLFRFLRLDPFGDYKVFEKEILGPWKSKLDDIATARLRYIVKAIMLRRSWTQVHLQEPKEYVIEVSFNAQEREEYQKAATQGISDLDSALDTDQQPFNSVYLNSLQNLNVLRFICNHGIRPSRQEAEWDSSCVFETASPTISKEEAESGETTLLRDLLSEKNVDESSSFRASFRVTDPDDSENESPPSLISGGRSTRASSADPTEEAPVPWAFSLDLVCVQCGSQNLNPRQDSYDLGSGTDTYTEHIPPQLCKNCLEYEKPVSLDLSIYTEHVMSAEPASQAGQPVMKRSTKIMALLSQITHVPTSEKSVVFSCWTQSLCAVEDVLSQNGISCVRYESTSNLARRLRVLDMFAYDPSIQVILMPISCAGVGAGLTAASHVFLLEPQWNPTVEAQAIAGVVRLGQTQQVSVCRFVVKDTCEQSIMKIQTQKLSLANLVVDRSTLQRGQVGKKQLHQLRGLVSSGS
ncbi:hypothetical protein AYO21_01141 [Fonsecaea monophora]|uniref:Helicase ATP-binding domain-containing protein n=1 Tax=Fonsecaea monophora TaxID=254056 RepID=A0A177FLG6_9EURO|nr:hypothetical protein AYO21_01141 [Fonsecaea monophora]OAG44651.1 hypothetical protein AYO21_01141 [Fonsecaea monophora]